MELDGISLQQGSTYSRSSLQEQVQLSRLSLLKMKTVALTSKSLLTDPMEKFHHENVASASVEIVYVEVKEFAA
jgi:hypothetical protein